jgi:Flp pilus assembly pilin Flp
MKPFDKIRSSALARDTRGLSTVEYVIILCLIAAVCVGTWQSFGSQVHERLGNSKNKIMNELKK